MEPDLTALTLSSKPIINPPKAVFGHPSLVSVPPAPSTPQLHEDGDEMDWAPTDPVAYAAFQKGKQRPEAADDDNWIRPQRFFAPEQPTGLEGLFEKTRLIDDVAPTPDSWSFIRSNILSHLHSWWQIYILSCILIILGVGYRGWLGRIASGV